MFSMYLRSIGAYLGLLYSYLLIKALPKGGHDTALLKSLAGQLANLSLLVDVARFLLSTAAIALVWVNSPWGDSYLNLVNYQVGIPALGLEMSLGVWAADALLAIFFFVVVAPTLDSANPAYRSYDFEDCD